MKQKEKIEELYSEYNPSFIANLDEAVIGFDLNSKKVVYSFQKALAIIMSDGTDVDSAREMFHDHEKYSFMDDLTINE